MQDFQIALIDGCEVIFDSEDAHLFDGHKWRVLKPTTTPYLRRSRLFFHRVVASAKDGEVVDHKNGNSLDNRKENLRIVTSIQNSWNRAKNYSSKSKFKGVGWSTNTWQVSIRDGKKQIYIGRFKCEFEAAYNYDLASLKYHGEHGRRNFLPLVVE